MATTPAQTSGLGVAAAIRSVGNVNPGAYQPGKNGVSLSLSGANGPTSFQLQPQIVDAAGNAVALGTAFVLTAVAASAPGILTLSAAAAASAGSTVYTGTITGGGSNALAGQTFVVAGFTTAANNGTFIATASTTTTLTLSNALGAAETHAGTATDAVGSAVYTGTITGGGTNAFAGDTFVVAGFATAANNGTFVATASSATTLTLANGAAVAETHAATATNEEITGGNVVTYQTGGTKNATTPNGSTYAKVVNVSATGLITTNGVKGRDEIDINFPFANNTLGATGALSPNPATGTPLQKVFTTVNVRVLA